MINKHSFFSSEQKVYRAKSPARLDVMGGIADYSGSLVLQMPLKLYTEVSVAKRTDNIIRIHSRSEECLFDIGNLPKIGGQFVDQKVWKGQDIPSWSLYILGCLFVLLDDKELPLQGLDISISSEIPIGAGISSSAALEVATLKALYLCYGLPLEQEKLAILAQKAENLVVGAPCGIMDQLAVHMGKKEALLPIICQPYALQVPVSLPTKLKLFAFNTHVKHSVSGNAYSKVRAAAFMGLSIILQHIGISQKEIQDSKTKKLVTLPYSGYLANITVTEFEEKHAQVLPQEMSGSSFKKQFGTTTDSLDLIQEDEVYHIYDCTKHPIYENHRIQQFSQLLQSKNPDYQKLGQLMFASHQGYVDCGLSCEEADFIIQQVKLQEGLYGARITGGGSGGTVCIMGEDKDAVLELQQLFEDRFSNDSSVFTDSTAGAYYL
ncbi:MAG: hypothetical protein AAFP82_12510 [Bacteroidota bacterium]